MTPEEVKNKIFDFLTEEIDISQVTGVDFQCGSCWIDFADGTTQSLSFTKCEE